jgi:hypothetical protein
MLIISTPKEFAQGSTITVKIDGNPATLSWRDHDTLIVDDTDAREIYQIIEEKGMLTFMCAGAAGEPEMGTVHFSSAKQGDE